MKKQLKPKGNAFLFFVFVALILIGALVAVQQIRIAQFNARLSSIEVSVTRIESGVGSMVGTVQRYERALNEPGVEDGRVEVGVGNRKEETN